MDAAAARSHLEKPEKRSVQSVLLEFPGETASATVPSSSPMFDSYKGVLDNVYEGLFMSTRGGAHGVETSEKPIWAEQRGAYGNVDAAVYGEIRTDGFQSLLDWVGFKPGEKYYDLGAGDGKTVMVAWANGFDAHGIELMPRRFQGSCRAVSRLRELEHKQKTPPTAGPELTYFFGSF